jgi:hypothetical protein
VAETPSALTPEDLRQARQTAERFLQAVQRGDEPAARELLILGKGEKMDLKSMGESIASYSLGEPQAEGERVVIVATVVPKPGQQEVPPLPMVLTRAGGDWKLDMSASINRMLGVDVAQMMNTLVQGIGDAMAKGMQAIGEGLSQGLSALSSPDEDGGQAGKREKDDE